jgi:hypothetical protein
MMRSSVVGPNLSSTYQIVGAMLVVSGVLFQALLLGRAAGFLSIALVAAYLVWRRATWSVHGRWLPATYFLGLFVFVLHVSEEFLHGFHWRLPALMGAPRWSDVQFLTFNLVWLVAFVLAAWAVRRRQPLSVLLVLFFAIAGGVGNGVAHLMLVLAGQAYFPGAWTAPLCLWVGAVLLRQMFFRKSAAWAPLGRNLGGRARDDE